MPSIYTQKVERLLQHIIAAAPKGASALQREFIRLFYLKMPLPELERMTPQHAAALALSAFRFAQKKPSAKTQIRLFHPEEKKDGYTTHHAALELLNNDQPFLVDSLSAELARLGFSIKETIHPVLYVSRDKSGSITALSDEPGKGYTGESLIHFEISALPETMTFKALEEALLSVLEDVRLAVNGWEEMGKCVSAAAEGLAKNHPTEAEFLRWLSTRNFIFLGACSGKTRLGLCQKYPKLHFGFPSKETLAIIKSTHHSKVHRAALMDKIKLRIPGKNGTKEWAFFGLFTSSAYYQTIDAIPWVRERADKAMKLSGFDPSGHAGKALKTIIEFLPRDEVLQMTAEELFEIAIGVLALEARPAVRLFARTHPSERFVSAMVFVPREYFSTDLRIKMIETLEKAYDAKAENFYTQMTESPLARLHVVLRTEKASTPDVAKLEAEIARFTYAWSDQLHAALSEKYGVAKGEALLRKYGNAFPPAYVARYSIAAALHDIAKCEEVAESENLAVDFYTTGIHREGFHLKFYHPGDEVALSDILPMLENMGFTVIEEHPFYLTLQGKDGAHVWLRDVFLTAPERFTEKQFADVKPRIEETVLALWQKQIENDGFNALVLKAGVNAREATVLRAYAKYLKQAGFAFAQAAQEQVLASHPALAALLVSRFDARFNPATAKRGEMELALDEKIEAALTSVSNLNDDRILRQYWQLIRATLRTNAYQQGKPVLSFKFRSAEVWGLPKPVPFAEIFVYSPRVEGIHLRGGKVARGGLRWSDRMEDFRTEVLGLMKAQMVKNSVIVPVGSKGGFVVKQPPSEREAFQREGVECYKLYLSGLLDLTDNIVGGKVKAPANVVRHDDDDPYLVVAADKGTAKFSDIANSVSAEYGFWLDDAFASGGSAGYDHKEMGITARGGWISVMRHFREMGVDISREAFTAVGIGDMSGDVFGNGALLSDTMKLVAAFNHQHIFIDPNPDPKRSFSERHRLFHLPRSGWNDYDAKLISKGGGVYERSAKSISLSREAQAVLGVTKANFTPDELIHAILCAPVDLLWNGGIGTYVKAEEETHEQVGDRANNALRANGKELRCKIVGEGGNLGFTQKGRIEYARAGGRINTDAIDNSGGVDCSDHEVNIKIGFAGALASGKLTRAKRDSILKAMTEDVAALVLKDNYLQTQAISLASAQATTQLPLLAKLMRQLEKRGLLDRNIEFLPNDRALAEMEQAGQGLTRPELAVLLAYAKIVLYREMLDSTLPDEPYFSADLALYFPERMRKDFAGEITSHPLKREIIATMATNSIVNRAGISFCFDLAEEAAASIRDVSAAYCFARDIFGLRAFWKMLDDAYPLLPAAEHLGMLQQAQRLVEQATRWALKEFPRPLPLEKLCAEFTPAVKEFSALFENKGGTPLNARMALLAFQESALDVITIAKQTGKPLAKALQAYQETGERLRLDWLAMQAGLVKPESHWDRLVLRTLALDIRREQRRLTLAILKEKGSTAKAGTREAHYLQQVEELQAKGSASMAALLVALDYVKGIA